MKIEILDNCKIKNNYVSFQRFTLFEIPKLTLVKFFIYSKENIYFFILSCVQVSSHPRIGIFPSYWNLTGYFSTIIPLLLCYLIECYLFLHIYYTDYVRTVNYNYRKISCIQQNKLTKKRSKDIEQGDVLCIATNEMVPTDCILLHVSGKETHGRSKLDFSNLNGETNHVYKDALIKNDSLHNVKHIHLKEIKKSKPSHLSDFKGNMIITLKDGNKNHYDVNSDHFIPGNVKNTGAPIIAIVFNVGERIRSFTMKHKKNKIYTNRFERQVGYLLQVDYVIILCLMVIVTTCMTILKNYRSVISIFESLIQNWILYNGLVPYSVKMLLLFNKKIQCVTFNCKQFKFTDFYSIDNLPNITHLISDKTGTLTQNKLELKLFSVHNKFHSIDTLCVSECAYESLHLKDIILLSLHFVLNDFVTTEDEIISQKVKELSIQFKFTNKYIRIDEKVYEVLDNVTLAFDDIRKVSSVIVKDTKTDEVYIVTKGAITSIRSKLTSHSCLDHDVRNLNKNYKRYRTLGIIIKNITSIYSKDEKNKFRYENKDSLYKYVTILCIEDPLQKNVRKTIGQLQQKRISVSMCTGDRKETAVEISRHCGIITLNKIIVWNEYKTKTKLHFKPKSYHFVFSGPDVEDCIHDSYFLYLLNSSLSFVGYQLTPKHKKLIIEILNKDPNKYVASIGDGVNDIPMLVQSKIAIAIKNDLNDSVVSNANMNIDSFSVLTDIFIVSEHCLTLNVLTAYFTFFKTILYHLTIFFFYYLNEFDTRTSFPLTFIQIQSMNTLWSTIPILLSNTNLSSLQEDRKPLTLPFANVKNLSAIFGTVCAFVVTYLNKYYNYDIYFCMIMILQTQYCIGFNVENMVSNKIIVATICLFLVFQYSL